METKLARWGNSVGIRLPKEIITQANLHTGDLLSISVEKGERIVVTAHKKRVTLSSLLGEISSENLHQGMETGEPRGGEAW